MTAAMLTKPSDPAPPAPIHDSSVADLNALGVLAEQALHARSLGDGAPPGLAGRQWALLQAISKCATGDNAGFSASVAALAEIVSASGAQVLTAGPGGEPATLLGQHGEVTLCQPAGDKPLESGAAGVQLAATAGERSRLWVQIAEGRTCWLHLLVKPDFEPAAEPVVALRYLKHNENEQLAFRFRRNGMVLHKEVDLPMPAGRPFFLSIGLIDGDLCLHVNAIPVYRRPARHPFATGYILDVIGIAQGPTTFALPLVAIETNRATPLGAAPDDIARLATGFAWMAHKSGQSRFHEALHSLEKVPLQFTPSGIREFIGEVRQPGRAYSAVLEDLLLARLPGAERVRYLESRPTPIIRVRDVSITLASNPGQKHLKRIFGSKEKVRVVDAVSFEAFSGDIVAIIGKNGAGKTTFLKSLVGAIPISAGRIDIADQPVLLRPGAGMQPDLTGRENIYKTGLYMDMSMSEIDAMLNDVVEFAELEDHIDRPIRYYSDGMRARLVFSMATAMPREILLLDELLSAGDMGFQERAVDRLQAFLAHAKLVFVVQHTFDFVLSRCTKCLLLEKGVPVYFGEPRIAIELYRESL